MLDVRPTAYIVPLDEQTIGPITPIIHVENLADENANITGLVRIYRESLGTLIYSSVLHPKYLAHDSSVDISAETEFNPGAPADDDYFILCEVTALATLTGNSETVPLGQFYFDVKASPMGPVPATHHTTHENGGMDEIDCTGLAGTGAAAHAASHQNGGADELDIADLATAEMDDALVLAPDGAGGVEFRTLASLGNSYRMDFIGSDYTHAVYPYFGNAIHAGTYALLIDCPSNHPGILQISSSTQANSGQQCKTDFCILLAGAEHCSCWHRPQHLTGTTRHYGFHDAIDVDDPFMGAWIWQDPTTGIIYGRSADYPNYSITTTGFQLVTNTWYLEKIVINSDASRADFYIYAEDGTLLWHDFLTANIPTLYTTANSSVVTHSGTSIEILDETDELSLYLPERRPQL